MNFKKQTEPKEPKEKNKILSSNRSLSIILLVISAVLLAVSLKVIIDFVMVNNERSNLLSIKNQILAENEQFKNTNDHLGDDSYYDIYVREEYQFEGNNVIKFPKK